MSIDFSKSPAYGKSHFRRFPGWLAALGPGIVWMALAQGSGELIWWPYLCAKYGLGFLFLLVPACLLQYSVTFEIGRYSAMTGESIWRGFLRLHPVFTFALWILMILSFLWFGAFAAAGGTALAELVNWPNLSTKGRSLFWGLVSITVFAFALLTQKKTYQLIEKTMWAVALLTVIGLVATCFSSELRPHWPSFRNAILWPGEMGRQWDPNDTDRLLTALTFAGLGGFWTLFYSYWIIGKGIGCVPAKDGSGVVPPIDDLNTITEGRKWRKLVFVDTGIGVFGNLFTTLMTCFLAYAVLFPQGIVPEGWRIAAEQAAFFEVSWGAIGKGLFLIISAAFLCDTWLSTADAVSRVHIEMSKKFFPALRGFAERRMYQVMILLLTTITGGTMYMKQPDRLIVVSAIIGFLGTVTFSIAIIILIHRKLRPALPASIRPGKISLIALSISATVYLLLAIGYIKVKLFGV